MPNDGQHRTQGRIKFAGPHRRINLWPAQKDVNGAGEGRQRSGSKMKAGPFRCQSIFHTPPYVYPLGKVNTPAYGCPMPKPRLSKEDWLAAGFRALASDGPSALRAEALARELKTTKGSFYWHFKDLPAYKEEMLELWREKVASDIVARVLEEPDPHARLDLLVQEAAHPAPEAFGGRAIEPAIRAWALSDTSVMEALKAVDQQRTDFIAELLKATGHNPAHAPLLYAAYLGLDDQAAKHGQDIAPHLSALITLIRAYPSESP